MTTDSTTSTDGILALWREGLLTTDDALRVLADDLRMLDDGIAVLADQRAQLDRQLVALLTASNGRANIPGFGELAIVLEPALFDTQAIEALIISLAATHPTIASELAACRTASLPRLVVRAARATGAA
jgi:hypothetical protein